MTDLEAIKEFYDNLIGIKSYSLNTADAYKKDVEEFLDFIISERMAPSLVGIRNNRVCKNYVSYLSSKDLASTSNEYSVSRKVSEKPAVVNLGEAEDMRSQTTEICPECGHDKAYSEIKQTRSADEAPTRIFECAKCGHKWRNYN